MNKIKNFFVTSLLGGVTVILPVAILAAVLAWIYGFVTNLIQPLTDLLVANSDFKEMVAAAIVIALILTTCFCVGVMVRTGFGKWVYRLIENTLLIKMPGYKLIKETIIQIFGNQSTPFSSVALVQIFGNETLVTAFVTEKHANGSFSVFVPTGPNPTSGNIYHLKAKYVHEIDVPVEDAMRSIISCGAGSASLLDTYHR